MKHALREIATINTRLTLANLYRRYYKGVYSNKFMSRTLPFEGNFKYLVLWYKIVYLAKNPYMTLNADDVRDYLLSGEYTLDDLAVMDDDNSRDLMIEAERYDEEYSLVRE